MRTIFCWNQACVADRKPAWAEPWSSWRATWRAWELGGELWSSGRRSGDIGSFPAGRETELRTRYHCRLIGVHTGMCLARVFVVCARCECLQV